MEQKSYKVIADYPNTKFEIGDILHRYYFAESGGNYIYTTNPESPLEGSNLKKEWVESMPHIFEEIQTHNHDHTKTSPGR